MAYTYDYPQIGVTADLVLFDRSARPRVLLIRRGIDPYAGAWALPGGYVNPDERIEDAVRREAVEETGAKVGEVRFLGYYDAIDRDPRKRTVTFAFWAQVDAGSQSIAAADDAAAAEWRSLDDLPDAFAFDHGEILRDAIAAARL